jgi:hypothetical protein
MKRKKLLKRKRIPARKPVKLPTAARPFRARNMRTLLEQHPELM